MDTDRTVLIMGILLLFSAVIGSIKQYIFNRRAIKKMGIVTEIYSVSDGGVGSGSHQAMKINFSNEEGKEISFNTTITDFRKYYEGQEIPILYDRKDPNLVFVNTLLQQYFVELIIGIISLSIVFAYYSELLQMLGIS